MQNATKLKVLDLFSGIGMVSYGLERTGLYETSAFCEVEETCRGVLKKNWPKVQIFEDISSVEGLSGYAQYKYYASGNVLFDLYVGRPVDVITGGFPCQNISNSGDKTGIEGDRSSLWHQMKRLIQQIKPKGVLIENVSAIRSRGLDTVLKGLNQVGYDAEWHCIPASNRGAIHIRDRMFILAYPSGVGPQGSWKPLQPMYPEEVRNREAGIVKYALQKSAVPYVCGDHAKCTGGVDRLKQLGNTVYWPIVEHLGYHLYNNISESLLQHTNSLTKTNNKTT